MLVCMYVCRPEIVKCQFFSLFFFSTMRIFQVFYGRFGKKTEKCQFLWSMYVCQAKTNICQFLFLFFCTFPSPDYKNNHILNKTFRKCFCQESAALISLTEIYLFFTPSLLVGEYNGLISGCGYYATLENNGRPPLTKWRYKLSTGSGRTNIGSTKVSQNL